MNMQLIKDFGKLLNDGRIGFCDVRSDKNRNVGYGDLGDGSGVIIGHVIFEHGGSKYSVIARDVHVTYDNIFECVQDVYRAHPTRTMSDVMYCIKYDLKQNKQTLAVTDSSNLELFDVRHRKPSRELHAAIEYAIAKLDIKYRYTYCDGCVSNFDKTGGFGFTLSE